MSNTLGNSALFAHVINGHSKIHAPVKSVELKSGDSLIMKCDKFVNNWFPNEDDSFTEVVIFRLNPEALQYIYNNQVPDFVQKSPKIEASSLKKISIDGPYWNTSKKVDIVCQFRDLQTGETYQLKVKNREIERTR